MSRLSDSASTEVSIRNEGSSFWVQDKMVQPIKVLSWISETQLVEERNVQVALRPSHIDNK